jgi:hypothetical protein
LLYIVVAVVTLCRRLAFVSWGFGQSDSRLHLFIFACCISTGSTYVPYYMFLYTRTQHLTFTSTLYKTANKNDKNFIIDRTCGCDVGMIDDFHSYLVPVPYSYHSRDDSTNGH